ncbi:MAG: tetratricopeptide repeat protein [Rhodomicrobium sp.]
MSRARAEPANEVSKPDIERVLAQALGFLRAGQTKRALDCLAARTDLAWDHSFACYLAGLIRVNLGQDAAALPFYDRSLALNPEYAEAIEARARLLQRAEKWEEAIAAYDALLRFQPAKALTAKAAILHGLGRNEEALQTYRQLIATSPDDAAAWYNCGAILATRGEQAEAYDHFQKALECDPGYGLALYGAATALQKLGRLEEALAICIKLLTQAPVEFKAWFLRGNILYALGRAAEALAAFDEALALDPKDLGALCNRGESLRQLGRLPEAAAMFGEALAANPRFVEALLGQGIVEFKSARTEEALGSFTAALEVDPASATAHCGRGLALQELGRFGEAMDDFKRSLALDPSLVEGHSNLGALQLLLGDFKRGWEGYEYRKLWGGECKVDAKALWPVWNGELIAGKKLLVLDEAAHGDIILLARYFPILAALGAGATFLCRPRMLELLKKVPGVRLTAEIGPSERFDYQVHLFSLPRVLKTRLQTIPPRVPYIEAEPALAAKWAERLGSHGFKIGIAWQGNPDPKVDMARAAPLGAFAPLAALPEVRLISLQKGFGTDQIESSAVKVETLGKDFDSGPHAFLDTAAVMANLDLIISVDTSVAHLAGAMGRPVFVALKHVPEWRWMLNRNDSPWYPAMRLFRQSARGDWNGVFAEMARAVEAMAAEKAAQPFPAALHIPAAVGELLDKIAILEIKAERIPDQRQRINVERELKLLRELRQSRGICGARLDSIAADLKRTNLALWDIEDAIRRCERLGDFGPGFIELARSVYKENDKRAALKREINLLCASAIVEEKYFPGE